MSLGLVTIQLGKSGYGEGNLKNIKEMLDRHKNIKVSVLRSYIRNQDELKVLKDKMLADLGENYTARIVGYSIFLKRWKRKMR